MSFYSETDQKAFDIFSGEIHAKNPNIRMKRTPDGTRHDVIVNDNIAVEIKTRLDLCAETIKTFRGRNEKDDLRGCVILNNGKLNYLKNLTGFEKVFIAYIVRDVYYIINVNDVKVRAIKPYKVKTPDTGEYRTEICAIVDITGEKEYQRLTNIQ